MYVIKTYKSEQFGNTATIEEGWTRPYKGAKKMLGYRLCCYADYDDGELYYCSCHESFGEAYNRMMQISGGEWKEVR